MFLLLLFFLVVPLGSLYLLKPIHGEYSGLPVELQQASNPRSETGSLQSHIPVRLVPETSQNFLKSGIVECLTLRFAVL